MEVLFLKSAEADLLRVRDYYGANASQRIAQAFIDQVAHTIDRLAEYPELGASVSPRLRILRLQHFPYSVIYRIGPDAVVIHALASQRRRPERWQASR
jgi:plasmid stabilization system protein ParE